MEKPKTREEFDAETKAMLSERQIAAIAELIPAQINVHELEVVVQAYYSGVLARSDKGLHSKSISRPGQGCALMNHVTHKDIDEVFGVMARRSACPRPGLEPFQGWWYLSLDHSLGRVDMETVQVEELKDGKMQTVQKQVMKEFPEWPVPDVEDHATAWAICANLLHMRMTANR